MLKDKLQYLLEHESYRICELLPCDRFVSFCNKRAIKVSRGRLERLEELGLFYPLARTTNWPYTEKIKITNERGDYESLGPLSESEHWEGKTRKAFARFHFGYSEHALWISEGQLWDPRNRTFVSWDSYPSEDGFRGMESYYSTFQAYELWHKLSHLSRIISADTWIQSQDKPVTDFTGWAHRVIDRARECDFRYDLPFLCQILSNRYFPQTQTNQSYYRLSAPPEWDWFEYCQRWNTQVVLNDLSLDSNDVRKAWEMCLFDGKCADPMKDWYDLVSFVKIEKRNLLKDKALRAQLWYNMEHMLRLFYRDITGEELPTPEGPITYKFVSDPEPPSEASAFSRLDEVVNNYGLNPRPSLILLVEGESEILVFPQLMDKLYGLSPSALGIQIASLGGVGQFTGSKKYDRYGALSRFIDYHHSRGTIVFVVVDNEGPASDVRKQLIGARSMFQPRMVTREEYVVVWERNIELDNFTDEEIALVMSESTDGRYRFSDSDVRVVREGFRPNNSKGLAKLYESACGYCPNKPKLLASLADSLEYNTNAPSDQQTRPIVEVLKKVAKLARQNSFPSDKWQVESGLEGGLFGEMVRNCDKTNKGN